MAEQTAENTNDASPKARVKKHFITPMLLQFNLPNSVKAGAEKAFYGDYAEALGEFTDDELAYAVKWMKTTRQTRTFPVIADCLEACKHARKTLQAQQHAEEREKAHWQAEGRLTRTLSDGTRIVKDPEEWHSHRVDKANKLIQSEQGRQAVRDGAIIGLHDFIRKHDRAPDRHEYQVIVSESRKTWSYVDDAIKDMQANGQDATMAIKLKNMMIGKYRMLSEKANSSVEVV